MKRIALFFRLLSNERRTTLLFRMRTAKASENEDEKKQTNKQTSEHQPIHPTGIGRTFGSLRRGGNPHQMCLGLRNRFISRPYPSWRTFFLRMYTIEEEGQPVSFLLSQTQYFNSMASWSRSQARHFKNSLRVTPMASQSVPLQGPHRNYQRR